MATQVEPDVAAEKYSIVRPPFPHSHVGLSAFNASGLHRALPVAVGCRLDASKLHAGDRRESNTSTEHARNNPLPPSEHALRFGQYCRLWPPVALRRLPHEDHTLGNALRFMLNKKYVLRFVLLWCLRFMLPVQPECQLLWLQHPASSGNKAQYSRTDDPYARFNRA